MVCDQYKKIKKTKLITTGLNNSGKLKNNLFKRWIKSGNQMDEENYRKHKAIYRRIANEAEISYYEDKLDTH